MTFYTILLILGAIFLLRNEVKVAVEHVRVVLENPDETLERLILHTSTTLNLLGLGTVRHLCLTGDKTEIERELEGGLGVFSPKASLAARARAIYILP